MSNAIEQVQAFEWASNGCGSHGRQQSMRASRGAVRSSCRRNIIFAPSPFPPRVALQWEQGRRLYISDATVVRQRLLAKPDFVLLCIGMSVYVSLSHQQHARVRVSVRHVHHLGGGESEKKRITMCPVTSPHVPPTPRFECIVGTLQSAHRQIQGKGTAPACSDVSFARNKQCAPVHLPLSSAAMLILATAPEIAAFVPSFTPRMNSARAKTAL